MLDEAMKELAQTKAHTSITEEEDGESINSKIAQLKQLEAQPVHQALIQKEKSKLVDSNKKNDYDDTTPESLEKINHDTKKSPEAGKSLPKSHAQVKSKVITKKKTKMSKKQRQLKLHKLRLKHIHRLALEISANENLPMVEA